MTISAGKLRHPVAIQEVTETDDGDGGLTTDWATIHTPWCDIRPATALEIFNAGQLQSVITHVIKLRFIAGIRADHRMLFETRIFQIVSVADMKEHEFEMEIQVEERIA